MISHELTWDHMTPCIPGDQLIQRVNDCVYACTYTSQNCARMSLHPFLPSLIQTLVETATNGVAYLHEGLSEVERKVVEQLYTSGAVQVII